MLRAVLSVDECERVISQHPATYVGDQFPAPANAQDTKSDFAVICFRPGETKFPRRPGYYRLDSDLNKLNQMLLDLSR